MASIALNKNSLKRERDQLKIYKQFLPSLDLKRQQLMTELKKALGTLAGTMKEIEKLSESIEAVLPLLGSIALDLSGYVHLDFVEVVEENVLGTKLPVLRNVEVQISKYSTLAKPFWVDALVDFLRQMVVLRLRRQIEQERVARLEVAVRRITQRVNLFEKVLIPAKASNIKRIGIYLADSERAAVVRSKIAKAKRMRRATS